MFKRKVAYLAAAVVILMIIMSIFAPWISPYDPYETDYTASLQAPSAEHWLGTDLHGRDVVSRIIYGARISMIIGVLAVLVAMVFGVALGMLSGYFGGLVDACIIRVAEMFRSIPQVIFAITLMAVFGGGFLNLTLVLGISSIPSYTYMMRAQVLSVKQSDYIMAATLRGCRTPRLLMTHFLPNCISPIIVMTTQSIGGTILAEAGLSFLGVGINPPTPSWGAMVSDGRNYLLQNPAMSLSPGFMVVFLVVSLNILGDGLRDALDPRLRGEV